MAEKTKSRQALTTHDHLEQQMLEQTIKASIEHDEDLEGRRIEFAKQLGEFAVDDSYKAYLNGCDVRDKVGIEIFKFKPNKSKNVKLFTLGLGGFSLNGEMEESTHVAKVVKLPVNKEVLRGDYKEGDLILLSVADTVGEDFNPQYMAVMAERDSNMAPKVPDDFKKKIHKIAARMYPFALVPPFDYNLKAEHISTFAIPEHFITGKYSL